MAKSKRRKACPLPRRFLYETQFAGYVVVLMRFAICFEYSASPAYQKICIRKFIKPVAMSINISEDDTRLAVLCRGGVTFVDKMDQFIWRG